MLLLLSFAMTARAVPMELSQQGRLLDSNNTPLNGAHILTVRLFSSETGGSNLWDESYVLSFTNGYYQVTLGDDPTGNPLDDGLLKLYPLYLELELDTDGPLTPRQPLYSAPFARVAGVAESLDGGAVNATDISINGNLVIDSSGAWVGETPAISWGDIQSIPADIDDGDDFNSTPEWSTLQNIPADIDDGDNDALAAISCLSGEVAKFDGALWYCDADLVLSESEVETFVTNASIELAAGSSMDGAPLLAISCAEGEIPVYTTSSGWSCGVDQDTTFTAQELQTMIEAMSLSLAELTVNGQDVLRPEWGNIQNIPADINDGDDEGLNIQCAEGEILTYSGGTWICSPFNTVIDADGDGALTWNDCDDSDPSIGNQSLDQDCDGILSGNDCDDNDPSSTIIAEDADCDGTLTADDCDDADAASTTLATDADCDTVLTADDCDDTDPAAAINNGTSSSCASTSCKAILDAGQSSGDGLYWVNPAGLSDSIEVHCDMTSDGGGWTRCGRYDEGDGTTSIEEGDYRSHDELLNNSFCASWYTNEAPTEMMLHNLTSGSDYGFNEKLVITWGSSPFTLYNYNNHPLQSCRMLSGQSWSTCWYAAHSGWEDTPFSFTVNGLENSYGGNGNRRLVLGPTGKAGTSFTWHNFGADTNSQNSANSWSAGTNIGNFYMR